MTAPGSKGASFRTTARPSTASSADGAVLRSEADYGISGADAGWAGFRAARSLRAMVRRGVRQLTHDLAHAVLSSFKANCVRADLERHARRSSACRRASTRED